VSPANTVEEGRNAVDLRQMLEAAAKKGYGAKDGGAAQSLDDLAGSVIAGPAGVIVEEVRAFQEIGARHLIFDLRARFDDWTDCLDMLGEEVIPELKRGDGDTGGNFGG
jgi:hypothetical protein